MVLVALEAANDRDRHFRLPANRWGWPPTTGIGTIIVDRQLRDRPIGAGVRLVVEDVHGAVAHLKEVDVAGDAGIGRRIGAAQQNAVLALQLQDLGGREPDRHLDGERRRVVRQHEALERLVPQPVVPYRRDDERGHAGREVLLLDDDQARGVDEVGGLLRSALAANEQLVRALGRNALKEIGDTGEPGVLSPLPQHRELRPVILVLVDLTVVELDRANGLPRRIEPAAFRAEPRVGGERAMLGEPRGDRRTGDAVAVAGAHLLGGLVERIAEVVQGDRGELRGGGGTIFFRRGGGGGGELNG